MRNNPRWSRKVILNKTSCKNPTLSHILVKPSAQSSTIFIARIMRDVHNNQQLQGMLEKAVIKLFSPCSSLTPYLCSSAVAPFPSLLLPHSLCFFICYQTTSKALPPAFFLSRKKKNVLILISQRACSDLHTPWRTLIPAFLRAAALWSPLGLWHLTHFDCSVCLVRNG